MTVALLMDELRERGFELWYEGDWLRFRAPKGALTPELRERLVAAKGDIVRRLRADASATEKTRPLSFSQQSLWFIQQQAANSAAYHVCLSARIPGAVNPAALRAALQALVDRHASLRTTYPFAGDAPAQRIAGAATVAFDEHAVPGMDESELRARVEADYRRPFDLENGPVFRASLYTKDQRDHVLLVTVHHIAVDGWSLMILLEELTKLYEEANGGAPAALERPRIDYADYTTWQEEMLASEEGQRLWRYWSEKLAPPRATLDLPADRPRPAMQSFRGDSLHVQLAAPFVSGVKRLAREEGTTPYVVLLATFQAFLFRLTGTNDVVVGSPTFTRSRPEFIRVVGDFVNTIPLRGTLSTGLSFRALVGQLRRTVLDGIGAQELPLPIMVQRLRPDRDSSRSPLFDTLFLLQRFDQFKELQSLFSGEDSDTSVEMGGLLLAPFPIDQQEGQFDLALQMVEIDDVLHAVFKYSTDLFDRATVEQFAADYAAIVQAIDADPDIALGALPAPARAPSTGPDARELLERLRARDIILSLDGEKLKVNAPKGAVTDDLRAEIGGRKSELIAALRAGATAAHGAPAANGNGAKLQRIPRDGSLPLSSAQQRLWFFDRMEAGSAHYNVGGSLRIRGPLDADVLRRAVESLVERHESLRTRIPERDSSPEAEIVASAATTFELIDISRLPPEAREPDARRIEGEQLRTPFDLARGPLGRYCLVRLAPDNHVLTAIFHHIVVDGWSLLILSNEVCMAYEAIAAGRAPSFAPLPVQYVDYAAWEQRQLQSGAHRPHLNYWKTALDGVPALLELPTDRPRPAAQTFKGHRLALEFDVALLEPLTQLGRAHDATLFMTLVAGFQTLLHRYSGQDDIVVGSPMANRTLPELEGIVGCFVNNLIVRGRADGNPTFTEFLQRVRRTTLDAFEHGVIPFDLIVDAVHTERGTNHAPIFQVLFTLHSFATDLPSLGGLRLEFVDPTDLGTARFDLSLEVAAMEGKFFAQYEFASDLFDEATILRMHAHLEQLLREIVADPSRRVADIPLLGLDETQRVLHEWNQTALEHDRTRCIHDMFDATARARLDDVALVSGDATMTFGELNDRANRLARLLVERNVPARSLIAICVDRSFEMPIAMLAVLKAGGAYVPLDPNHPADRLRYIVDDAGVACAITSSRFAPLLDAANAPLVLLDECVAELAALPSTAPNVDIAPSDRAYVIYTSGSTGRPKGVEVEHRNVVAFLEAMRREPGFTPDDVLLAVTTLSFDIAGLEFWLPLTTGGRVVIASRTDVLEGERLIALIRDHDVTVMQATPATWRLMLDAGWAGERRLEALCGGEALPADLAAALVDRVGELWNMYGPTETTIWSTVSRITDPAAPITIGRPIHNTHIYVLEHSGQPAPIGVPGELCIGGEGVSRGYHNRPELTAEKFVTITLPGGLVERVYRTGDVARLRADGRIDFLGRRDNQVKVRGYRIELGEIESILADDPAVKECVVIVREDAPGDQRIVAYVVAASGQTFDPEATRTSLRGRLPEYMIPNAFVELPALPLTPNGKIDRKALPAPNAAPKTVATGPEIPMTPVQRRIAAVWRDVLRTDRVGLHDNFFDIGGHSLLLVKLHAALKREFTAPLELVELFQWTTVAGQATRLSGVGAPNSALRRAQSRAARQTDA